MLTETDVSLQRIIGWLYRSAYTARQAHGTASRSNGHSICNGKSTLSSCGVPMRQFAVLWDRMTLLFGRNDVKSFAAARRLQRRTNTFKRSCCRSRKGQYGYSSRTGDGIGRGSDISGIGISEGLEDCSRRQAIGVVTRREPNIALTSLL